MLLINKEEITITNASQKILDEPNCKPNEIWVDTGSELYNRSMKSWPEENVIEIYLTHNEGNYVIAERFIRTLIYKYMTPISK